VIERCCDQLARGELVDLVRLTAEFSGATVCALIGVAVDPLVLAQAARDAAAAAALSELPGLRRGSGSRAAAAAARLTSLLTAGQSQPGPQGDPAAGLAAMLAMAAVNTTVAAIPRAVAWCAATGAWAAALDQADRAVLVDELLRVVSPTPLMPRVAAADGLIGRHRVRRGDRLLLVVRHAAAAHRRGPRPADPAPRQLSQLVFGVGPHACPGARLARAQLDDVLRMLAPYQPHVVRASADRRSALPGWACMLVRSSGAP
jgi:cytochrome P450